MLAASFAIGELSRRTGCNIETIRFYERVGLLPQAARRGRYRSYGDEDVARLGFARRARELGFTLDDIRALFHLSAGDQASCREVRELAAEHLADVRGRIADLQRMERVLAKTVRDCAEESSDRCPMIEALTEGGGPL